MQDWTDKRVPHEEHIAPCGVDFTVLNTVKKNFAQWQTGHSNLMFGIVFFLHMDCSITVSPILLLCRIYRTDPASAQLGWQLKSHVHKMRKVIGISLQLCSSYQTNLRDEQTFPAKKMVPKNKFWFDQEVTLWLRYRPPFLWRAVWPDTNLNYLKSI